MAFTIQSSVGTSMAAATGRSTQNHLVYAVNQGAYHVLFLNSTQGLTDLYSTNSGGLWNATLGSPYTLRAAHGSEGRNFGFCYANLASTDVLHMASGYDPSGTMSAFHARFTLGSSFTNTNIEAAVGTPGNPGATAAAGCVTILDSAGRPTDLGFGILGGNGGVETARATNTDSGASWTAGFGAGVEIVGVSTICTSNFFADLGSQKVLAVADNGPTTGKFTNLEWAVYNAGWGAASTALASAVTSSDSNNWGAVAVSTTDVHVVAVSNNSNTFVHRRFNGTSWSSSSGAPGTLTLNTSPSGIALVTDGTNVYAGAIDSSKQIQTNTWTSGGGWGGWTILESARSNTPAYITGVYNPIDNEVMFAWTETNGTNHDIIGSVLTLSAGGAPFPVFYDSGTEPAAQMWDWAGVF